MSAQSQGDKAKKEEEQEESESSASGSCPADKTINLKTGGGKTLAFSYEPLCAAASDLSYVAIASIMAALYVGRAFGGA